MGREHIVIAVGLVVDAVPLVRALVGLDADHRVPNAQAVIKLSSETATAGLIRVHVRFVGKLWKVLLNTSPRLQLFEAVRFRAWVFREKKFEACGAIVVVIRVTPARVWPCDAVRTPETAAMP
jgi:hypothetical protein